MAMITFPKDPEKNCFALIGRNLVLKENGDHLTFQDLLELKEREDAGDFFSEPDNQLCALELTEANTKQIRPAISLRPIRKRTPTCWHVPEPCSLGEKRWFIVVVAPPAWKNRQTQLPDSVLPAKR